MTKLKLPSNILTIQSHVVYGYAGNKSVTLPMQLCGVNVWPLNTVQFSTSTRYPKFTGPVTSVSDLTNIAKALAEPEVDFLKEVNAVYSGYLGSEEQVAAILEIVALTKKHNPQALYLLDPVMGKPGRGCIVAPGIAQAIARDALPQADLTCPNLEELQILAGKELHDFKDAVRALVEITKKGPQLAMVKHLNRCALGTNGDFEALLFDAKADKMYHLTRPLVPLAKDPVGAGDMIAGIFLATLLEGKSPVEAFEHSNNAVYRVVDAAYQLGTLELQPVVARREIMEPTIEFKAKELDYKALLAE